MKKLLGLMSCILVFGTTFVGVTRAVAATTNAVETRLTVELRDGSRVVGQSMDDTVSVHSAAIGNLKLAWATIRAIEYAASADTARLTATNGDGFAVQLDADTLRLTTDFGKTELPVKMIHSIKVTPETKRKTPTATPAVIATGFRLTIELRDGSHLVGKGLDDALNFHSATMGDLKLTWSGIRSIIFATEKSPTARLTTTNGDAYEVEFVTPAVRVETSFGKNELPTKSIRSIKVSAISGRGQLPEGLVALWSGEGDGKDSVGGHDAELTDITFADGKVGQAFSLNGISSWMKIPGSDNLDVGKGDGFTVSAWIKPANVMGFHPILEWEVTRQKNAVSLWIGHLPQDRGVLLCSFGSLNGQNKTIVSAQNAVLENQFQHVAITYDKTTGIGRLFLNERLVGQQDVSFLTPDTTGPLFISRQPCDQPGDWTYNSFFSGLLDEISIYNRALSAAEIREEYETGNKN